MAGHGEGSVKAILYALGANGGNALAKGVAAFWTGSGAMLAETIHSLADCGNQVLLLCFEADHNLCHRSMVADAVKQVSGMGVCHIRAPGESQCNLRG